MTRRRQPFNYRHVKQPRRPNRIKEPSKAICTSGFGHAGTSIHLLTEWARDEDNSVPVSSGCLPSENPLKSAEENVELLEGRKKIRVRAEIELSGHADQKKTLSAGENSEA